MTQEVTDTERSLNNSILNLQYLSTAGCRDQIFWGYSCWEDAETLLHGLNSWKRTSLARMLDEFLHLPFPNWWAFLSCKLIPSGNTFPIFVQKIKFCNKKPQKILSSWWKVKKKFCCNRFHRLLLFQFLSCTVIWDAVSFYGGLLWVRKDIALQ